MGLAILLGAVFLYWHLDSRVVAIKATIAINASTEMAQAIPLLSAIARASERQLKLLELVAIPLAVSLIAAAVLLRVDREFTSQLAEYSDARDSLADIEDEVQNKAKRLDGALAEGMRGQPLLDLHKDLIHCQAMALHRFIDLDDRFARLIRARFVPAPTKKRRKRDDE